MTITYDEFEKDPMKYIYIAETEEVLLEKKWVYLCAPL